MSLSNEQKANIIKEFGKSETDTGSPEVQIALLSANTVSYTHLTLPTKRIV